MNCPNCNENNKQRKDFEKYGCGCCNGARKISFNRYVQYNLGWVLWLNHNGSGDASVETMRYRCQSIIEECFHKYNKSRLPIIKRCEDDDMCPRSVMVFYANQFKGEDCLTIH